MSFGGLILTNAGRNKIAAAISEKNALQFTHIQLGDGDFNGSYSSKTALSHKVMEIPVTGVQRNGDAVLIECDWNSKQAPTSFYMREIGIIGNGVLCYYDNARNGDAEYINPESEVVAKQKRFRFTIFVTDDVEIATMISSELYALKEDVEQSLNGKLDKTGDAKDAVVTFSEAAERANISSREKLSIILGKIKRLFTDLKTVAFTGSYTDLSDKPRATDVGALPNTTNYAASTTPGGAANYVRLMSSNEFNMVGTTGQTSVHFNYKNPDTGKANNTKITDYYFQSGQANGTGYKDVTLHVGNIDGKASSASSAEALSSTLSINKGGTGQTTALNAINALLANGATVMSPAYIQSDIRTTSIKNSGGGTRTLELSMPYTNQLLFKDTSYATDLGWMFKTHNWGHGYLEPMTDIKCSCGSTTYRWLEIHAQNGNIQTSDRREKCEISYIGQDSEYDTSMTDEQLEILMMGISPVVYKRINGQSGRPHHGLIAQDFEELLKEIGIPDHAGLIKSPLTEEVEEEVIVRDQYGKIVYDDEGNPQKNKIIAQKEIEGEYRYGFRYEELVTDIIRFTQILNDRYQNLQEEYKSLKERLEALEKVENK